MGFQHWQYWQRQTLHSKSSSKYAPAPLHPRDSGSSVLDESGCTTRWINDKRPTSIFPERKKTAESTRFTKCPAPIKNYKIPLKNYKIPLNPLAEATRNFARRSTFSRRRSQSAHIFQKHILRCQEKIMIPDTERSAIQLANVITFNGN